MNITDEGHESGGSEEPDSWDSLKAVGDRVVRGEAVDLALDIAGAGFEVEDFGADLVECGPQPARDIAIGILDQGSDG